MIVVQHNNETDKYRLVNEDTGLVAVNSNTGTPLDGGGHDMEDKAERQAGYINKAIEKKSQKGTEENKK